METTRKTFQTFEDLEVYKAASLFRKLVYDVSRQLPDFEKYALGNQIRRAAVSLTNNIAEGHGRFHYPDQIKFGLQARGSLEELIDDLNVCRDEKYLPDAQVERLKQEGWRTLNLLNGYLRFLRARRESQQSSLRETPETYATRSEDSVLDLEL